MTKSTITVKTIVNAPIERVWECFIKPEHIVNWAFASPDWEAPRAENDVRVGGTFLTVMAAKDKSASFDFTGEYTKVENHRLIAYTMSDGREVCVEFTQVPEGTEVVETFDPEHENPKEMQQTGWQAILENFKKYVEAQT